jgi:hypothetical protein
VTRPVRRPPGHLPHPAWPHPSWPYPSWPYLAWPYLAWPDQYRPGPVGPHRCAPPEGRPHRPGARAGRHARDRGRRSGGPRSNRCDQWMGGLCPSQSWPRRAGCDPGPAARRQRPGRRSGRPGCGGGSRPRCSPRHPARPLPAEAGPSCLSCGYRCRSGPGNCSYRRWPAGLGLVGPAPARHLGRPPPAPSVPRGRRRSGRRPGAPGARSEMVRYGEVARPRCGQPSGPTAVRCCGQRPLVTLSPPANGDCRQNERGGRSCGSRRAGWGGGSCGRRPRRRRLDAPPNRQCGHCRAEASAGRHPPHPVRTVRHLADRRSHRHRGHEKRRRPGPRSSCALGYRPNGPRRAPSFELAPGQDDRRLGDPNHLRAGPKYWPGDPHEQRADLHQLPDGPSPRSACRPDRPPDRLVQPL